MPRGASSPAVQKKLASSRAGAAGVGTKKRGASAASRVLKPDRTKKSVASAASKPLKAVRKKTAFRITTKRPAAPDSSEPSQGEVVWPRLPQIRGKGKLSDRQITAAVRRAIAAVDAKHAARTAEASDDRSH